ncbi:RNA methyltransferase, TrmH family [Haloechinothrix alba]|uniref:RNA methyltransferase, TrmH family n=1 Tax=Haloechinothrix alba TaxID=664784 RepID=A0A238ZPQ1_9PSEU|nr:RNA methyltransferase, TrmH family [Haloechinothrix alba]
MPADQQPEVFTHKTPRVAAARRLTTRSGRSKAGRFLAEGAQAVGEALASAHRVHELFVAPAAAQRNGTLLRRARDGGVTVSMVTERAGELLSETVTPQGLVAVCDSVDVPLPAALAGQAHLVAVLVGVTDPGNAGTVVRTADAAGADAVVFLGDSVDVHNGKSVRASAGSVFHVPIARAERLEDVLAACRTAGLTTVAADGKAQQDLVGYQRSARLGRPTAWLFGSEAHGLDGHTVAAADEAVRVPIYGGAESLNLASAATVCLYSSAMARRQEGRSD